MSVMEVILSGLIGAIIGGSIGGYATYFAMEKNRKKQVEIEFLKRNYLRIIKSFREEKNGRPEEGYELQAAAIDEIQLYGDLGLAKSAREVCITAGRGGAEKIWSENLDKLHNGLRSRLRAELGLERIDDIAMNIAYTGQKKVE